MTASKLWSVPTLATLVLAACGGGAPDAPATQDASVTATSSYHRHAFTSLVSFGDSLSDVGTYTPATVIPGTDPPVYLGGKFTTNSATSTIWVENLAARLGLAVTPAEVGFNGQSVHCPAAAQGREATCTAYGQGGARVTDPNGVRHDAGALTVPIKTQIANHLARFASFKDGDLVVLWAGANDLLWQVDTDPNRNPDSFVVKLFQIQARLQAGQITPAQAQAMLAAAELASKAAMRTAALELTGYIRTQIIGKGASHVMVLNLPDPATTPEGAAISAQSPTIGAAMTAFSNAFNDGLRDGLANQRVQLVNVRHLISDVIAHPDAHRMVNASVPACDADKMALITGGGVTDGSSLFCNATPGAPYNGIRTGADVTTWFFADGNHPTVGGYKLISDEVIRLLKSCDWMTNDA